MTTLDLAEQEERDALRHLDDREFWNASRYLLAAAYSYEQAGSPFSAERCARAAAAAADRWADQLANATSAPPTKTN